MTHPRPTIGRIVHYRSHGTPYLPDGSQAYAAQCRAAVVTDVPYPDDPDLADCVGLAVLNPTGMFFHQAVHLQEADGDTSPVGGTWHWPERS